MPGKRRSATKHVGSGGAVAMVVAVLMTLLAGWAAYGMVSGDDNSTVPGPGGQSATPPGTGASGRTALAACAAGVSKAEGVVSAASRGVSHWNTHVQARTDLVEGRISEERMRALWKATRLAGPADQERFQAALRQHDGSAQCSGLRHLPDGLQRAAGDCVARSKAADQAMAAAQAAMGDWRSHLDNMAAFANGEMTPAEAQHHWVQAWREAPSNISAYQEARAALAEAPRCTSADG